VGQEPSQKAWDLLTPAELEAAIGGSVAHASENETAYKKNDRIDHDGILYESAEAVGDRNVTIKWGNHRAA
jgi:hypothetical protein